MGSAKALHEDRGVVRKEDCGHVAAHPPASPFFPLSGLRFVLDAAAVAFCGSGVNMQFLFLYILYIADHNGVRRSAVKLAEYACIKALFNDARYYWAWGSFAMYRAYDFYIGEAYYLCSKQHNFAVSGQPAIRWSRAAEFIIIFPGWQPYLRHATYLKVICGFTRGGNGASAFGRIGWSVTASVVYERMADPSRPTRAQSSFQWP